METLKKMLKRPLAILLAVLVGFAMMPVAQMAAGFTGGAYADEVGYVNIYIYSPDGKDVDNYYASSDGKVRKDSATGEEASLPTGLTWDGTNETLIMNGYSGGSIVFNSHPTTENANDYTYKVKLVGNNTLIGSKGVPGSAAIHCYSGSLEFTEDSTGILDINENRDYETRAIYVPGSLCSCYVNGGTVNINVTSKGDFINGVYAYSMYIRGDSNVSMDLKSTAEKIDKVFGMYWGQLYCETSGNVSIKSNKDALSSSLYLGGTGNVWIESASPSNDSIYYTNDKTSADYLMYGVNETKDKVSGNVMCALGDAGSVSAATAGTLDLAAPVVDQVPQTVVTTDGLYGAVTWNGANPPLFDGNTAYTATIKLYPRAGYKMGTYTETDFTLSGASSVSYADGVITATYPATEESAYTTINPVINLAHPAAGTNLPTSISGDGYTGSVKWYVVAGVTYSTSGEALENTTYKAEVTLTLTDGGNKKFVGVPADGYSLTDTTGTTVTNDADSNKFTVTFAATGTAPLNVNIDGTDCTSSTDFETLFGDGVSYDSDTNSLVLNNFKGKIITNKYNSIPLNIIVKGDKNKLTGEMQSGEKTALYSYGGDINIKGDGNNAKLRIDIDDSRDNVTRSSRGIFASYRDPYGNVTLDNLKVSIKISQQKQASVCAGVFCNKLTLNNGATVDVNMDEKTSNWSEAFWCSIYVNDNTSFMPIHAKSNQGREDRVAQGTCSSSYVKKTNSTDGVEWGFVNNNINTWEFKDASVPYTGSEAVPEFTLLKKDVDYTISGNTEVGNATAAVTGTGDFADSGSRNISYKIVPALTYYNNITDLSVFGNSDAIYKDIHEGTEDSYYDWDVDTCTLTLCNWEGDRRALHISSKNGKDVKAKIFLKGENSINGVSSAVSMNDFYYDEDGYANRSDDLELILDGETGSILTVDRETNVGTNLYGFDNMSGTVTINGGSYDINLKTPAGAEGIRCKDLNVNTDGYLNINADGASDGKAISLNYGGHISEKGSHFISNKDLEDTVSCAFVSPACLSVEADTYNGSAKTPVISPLADTCLVEGTDYTVKYYTDEACTAENEIEKSELVNAGTYYIKAVCEDEAEKVLTYTINKKSIEDMTAELSQYTYTYNGAVKTPTVTIDGLTEGTDFTVKYAGNINAGNATATITGKGNYTGTLVESFQIGKAEIAVAGAKWSGSKTYTYSGSKKTISLTGVPTGVKASKTGYTGTAVGTYTAKATLSVADSANYVLTGKTTVADFTWKIVPKKATISKLTPGTKKLTVKMGTKVSSTGGATYQVQYRVKGTSKWTTKTTTSQTITLKSLKKGKTYQVKVRAIKTVKGHTYEGEWSAIKTSGKIK